MNIHRLVPWIIFLCCGSLLLPGCSTGQNGEPDSTGRTPTLPPTPATPALQISDVSSTGARLRITLPSVKLLKHQPNQNVQLFLLMSDTSGGYTYLFYPANRAGEDTDQFDLTTFPLELGLDRDASEVIVWILAVHSTHYATVEAFGLDALASSLAIGFRSWLARGDPTDDPLAAVVSESDGALFEWFAATEVLGQGLVSLEAENNWDIGMTSLRSPDGGLNVVYTVQYLPPHNMNTPGFTPTPAFSSTSRPGYTLRVDEAFERGKSDYRWYQGQDSTFVNQIVEGAYEIRLTAIKQRNYGLSWGSIEGARFKDYVVEAELRLAQENVVEGRYGLWFHYQDDYNFIYFGLSNRGEYRVATIKDNSKKREIQPWTPNPAIRTGTATNILAIETGADGSFALEVNGERLITFSDQTFAEGSIAFFCYAESVPTTCRLERLRVWERTE